jgi:uncharacterized membrane protein (UPF0127 family)
MTKLIHNKKTVLKDMKIAKSVFEVGWGLMFASKKKIDKGMCLVVPSKKEKKYGASLTNLFVFSSLDCIFLSSDYEVVDKTCMKSFQLSYTPKKSCKYVVESSKNKFKNIKIGDKITIKE